MLTFHIVTLFPEAVRAYLDSSILGRAAKRKVVAFDLVNLRPFGEGRHKKVDDRPFGGGAGMVLMAGPLCKAVASILRRVDGKKKPRTRNRESRAKIILFSAKGKPFNQKLAYQWAKRYDHLVLVAGRYEGIDERARKALKAEEISVGPYVLTDGDVAAMVVASAVGRLVPGAIKLESLAEESHWNLLLRKEAETPEGNGLEYPHYTRPESFRYKGRLYKVPAVLKNGDHGKIAAWRRAQSGRRKDKV